MLLPQMSSQCCTKPQLAGISFKSCLALCSAVFLSHDLYQNFVLFHENHFNPISGTCINNNNDVTESAGIFHGGSFEFADACVQKGRNFAVVFVKNFSVYI